MPLEVICARCKKPFTTGPGDVISGRWRLCPDCRDEQPPATSTRPIDAPAAA